MPKFLQKIRRRNYVLLALASAVYLFSTMCTSPGNQAGTSPIRDTHDDLFAGTGLPHGLVPGPNSSVHFAQGSVTCGVCHHEIGQSHLSTAHYRDSRPASAEFIRGSFDSGRNRFVYSRSGEVIMQHRGDRFYQTFFHNGKEEVSKAFDIVIGSGRKGQTYLYWGDDQNIFQLPVSWFAPTDIWTNSPGLYAEDPDFNRPIAGYCLECHTTFAKTLPKDGNPVGERFDKDQIIYGIDCERCHGPGQAHVDYHTAHPGEKMGRFIINAGRLSRQQKMDACALCHSGWRQPIAPAFTFRVGDNLMRFSVANHTQDSAATLDVHGNQYGLLKSSKCFIRSGMDCSSCHNVHVNDAGNKDLYSQRCMNCHNQATHNTCSMPPTAGLVVTDNCIDCHMPALTTKKIILETSMASDSTKNLSPQVRTHHIAIYPEKTKEYLEKIRSEKKTTR